MRITPQRLESATERTAPLYHVANDRRLSQLQRKQDGEAQSIISAVTKEKQQMASSTVEERLPYNDCKTIDWLHNLVKDTYSFRYIQSRKSLRRNLISRFEACSGWIAAILIGTLTACLAFVVDVAEATVSDWKLGCCTRNPFLSLEACSDKCEHFRIWTYSYTGSFAIYVITALAFGVISSSATILIKHPLPAVAPEKVDEANGIDSPNQPLPTGKVMYIAAGSGIPEIKTVFLWRAIFTVAIGMCFGKEGPFVHISTCVGYIVRNWYSKYRDNGRKLRKLLSAACASGPSVAFGAPIGGVLFGDEEISTYFPKKVLWRAFLCSLFAAIILKALNRTGTGKLKYPVFEVFLAVLATTLLQFPTTLTREPGDVIIKNLLVGCRSQASPSSWSYVGWLIYGTLVKLVLIIITFGCKVASGVIIPALDAGALFGRLIGQSITSISPGHIRHGELEYIIPHMIAILVAKWVADTFSEEGVMTSHKQICLLKKLIPPKRTMEEITVHVPLTNRLHGRGLMDAGLALVQSHTHPDVSILQGYISLSELEFGLTKLIARHLVDDDLSPYTLEVDLTSFVDKTPLSICEKAPLEYAMEMF
ncbi:Clc chloride channel [Zopfia rhizophila CBS 207.26]|uniref:Clc chloride channel n=1 Tax=Zopfia rhizophila CBS 207.26 TaxID=1314779 RepID=A0A6A6EGH3_9PEZI|nr:Clc chloride channel [Zopfia rhizophila CBS 207.26]